MPLQIQESSVEDLSFTYKGEKLYVPSGTKIANSTTITGNSSVNKINDVNRLVDTYGGEKEEWKKRAGKVESNRFVIDIYWYKKKNGITIDEKIKDVHE